MSLSITDISALPRRVRDGLASGELGVADLTARQLGAYLGKTSSVLYHHFGSLDGFLYRVSQSGFELLGARLMVGGGGDLADVAAAFVGFGLDAPALYQLMFERHYPWSELRAQRAFEGEQAGLALWQGLIRHLASLGSSDPDTDARVLHAGLHGLVSLALSGRANVGDLSRSDRDVAISSARRLALLLQTADNRSHQETTHDP